MTANTDAEIRSGLFVSGKQIETNILFGKGG
jgi:hypothetical protein